MVFGLFVCVCMKSVWMLLFDLVTVHCRRWASISAVCVGICLFVFVNMMCSMLLLSTRRDKDVVDVLERAASVKVFGLSGKLIVLIDRWYMELLM